MQSLRVAPATRDFFPIFVICSLWFFHLDTNEALRSVNVSLNVSIDKNRQLTVPLLSVFGVPYGSRTRVAAVKEKRFTVIQVNLAACIALNCTSKDSRELLLDS